jgi:hypothetical protein
MMFFFLLPAPVLDDNFWLNITDYLDCTTSGPPESKWTLDTSFVADSVEVVELRGNGTFCFANSSLSEEDSVNKYSCSVVNHPQLVSMFKPLLLYYK